MKASDIQPGDVYYVHSNSTGSFTFIVVDTTRIGNTGYIGVILKYVGTSKPGYKAGFSGAADIASYLTRHEHKKLFNLCDLLKD